MLVLTYGPPQGFYRRLLLEIYFLATIIPFIGISLSFLITEICPMLVRRFISEDFNFCSWDLVTGILLFFMAITFVMIGLANVRVIGLTGFTNELGFFNSIAHLLSRFTFLRNPIFTTIITLLGAGLITGLVPDYFNSTIKGDCEATNSSPLIALMLGGATFLFGGIIAYLFSFLIGVDVTFK